MKHNLFPAFVFLAFFLLRSFGLGAQTPETNYFTFGEVREELDATLPSDEAEFVFVSHSKSLVIKSNNKSDSVPQYPVVADGRYEYHVRLKYTNGVDRYDNRLFDFTVKGNGNSFPGKKKTNIVPGKRYTMEVEFVQMPINLSRISNGGIEVEVQQQDAATVVLESELDLDISYEMSGVSLSKGKENGKNVYTVHIPTTSIDDNSFLYVQSQDGKSNRWDVNVSNLEARSKVVYGITRAVVRKSESECSEEMNYVVFNITPKDANAKISIDGMSEKEVEDGSYQQKLSTGAYHTYSVTSKDDYYYQSEGMVLVKCDKVVKEVNLLPHFGTLQLKCDAEINGAEVLLDGKSVGKLPLRQDKVPSGKYQVTVKMSKYKSVSLEVVVEDGKTTTENIQLSRNFAHYSFEVPEGTNVYVNDIEQIVTRGVFEGDYEGTIEVRLEKEYHRPVSQTFTVTPGVDKKITLPAPTPITCRLEIESNRTGAHILIDGTSLTEVTPSIIENQLIGPHKVTVRLDGYCDETQSVDLKEGEYMTLSFELKNKVDVHFVVDQTQYEVEVDGESLGHVTKAPLSVGNHNIRISADGFDTYETSFTVSKEGSSVSAFLRKKLGDVTFHVTPQRSQLSVDGRGFPIGKKSSIEFGKHSVNIKADGYRTLRSTIDVRGSENYSFSLKPKGNQKYDELSTWGIDVKGAFSKDRKLLGASVAITPRKFYGFGVYGNYYWLPGASWASSENAEEAAPASKGDGAFVGMPEYGKGSSSSTEEASTESRKTTGYGFVGGVTKRIGAGGDSKWDWQVFCGAGGGQHGLLLDAGVKVGFEPTDFKDLHCSLINLSAGVMYEPMTNNYYATVGLSVGDFLILIIGLFALI